MRIIDNVIKVIHLLMRSVSRDDMAVIIKLIADNHALANWQHYKTQLHIYLAQNINALNNEQQIIRFLLTLNLSISEIMVMLALPRPNLLPQPYHLKL